MIIVKIHAGLGNQMFQYSLGRALSLRSKDELKFDLSWFNDTGDDINRPFKLDIFDIDIKEADENKVKNIVPGKWKRLLGLYDHKKYIKEKHFNFDEDVINLKGDVYLDGYWQSWKYFSDFEDVIRKDLILKDGFGAEAEKISNIIKDNNSVSLHVRRGDYVQNLKTNAYHGTCSMEYYKKAIEYIKNKVGDMKLFIFSDDIEWAKEQELFKGATFVSHPGIKDYEEIMLMSLCKYNIVANSSFSWWGAWLNSNNNKIVVAPSKWFNVPKDTSDLIPDNWVRV